MPMWPSRTFEIILWKVAHPLVTPWGRTLYSKNPYSQEKAVYFEDSGWSRIWLYEEQRSMVEKILALFRWEKISSIFGIVAYSSRVFLRNWVFYNQHKYEHFRLVFCQVVLANTKVICCLRSCLLPSFPLKFCGIFL